MRLTVTALRRTALAALGTVAAPVSAALPPPPPGVQTSTAYGIEFATVGAPGNAPTTAGSYYNYPQPVGTVPYSFAISRTEVTASVWLEFVRAYAPYYAGSPADPSFTSFWIQNQPGGGFASSPAYANSPVGVSWYMGARFCNWLTNGKRPDLAAFQTGAYDLAGRPNSADDPHPTRVPERMPGAKFWIPSRNEWIKAAYYDPDRLGSGIGDYWPYPNRSLALPVPGRPGTPGATTSAGPVSGAITIPVAAYPDAQSAFGLFDISGGLAEWTDTSAYGQPETYAPGSSAGDGVYDLEDSLAWSATDFTATPATNSPNGIRIATSIPAPSSGILAAFLGIAHARRKRCPASDSPSSLCSRSC